MCENMNWVFLRYTRNYRKIIKKYRQKYEISYNKVRIN